MKKPSKKTKLATVLAILSMGLIACQSTPQSNPNSGNNSQTIMPGQGVSISSSASVSTYGIFVTEIVNIGLEKLGYSTEAVKELDIPVAHISIGNGDIDFYGVHWQKLHEKFFSESGGDEKIERVGVIIADAVQGYQIDKNTADKYKITNLEQLKDPNIAKLFDTDGNGKAIILIETYSHCLINISNLDELLAALTVLDTLPPTLLQSEATDAS